MSNSPQDSVRQWLAAYLDGTLSEQARAEFMRELRANPALQAELQLQHQIDASLTRGFRPHCPAGRPLGPIARGGRRSPTIRYPGAATLGHDRRRGRGRRCLGVLGMAVFLAGEPATGLQP